MKPGLPRMVSGTRGSLFKKAEWISWEGGAGRSLWVSPFPGPLPRCWDGPMSQYSLQVETTFMFLLLKCPCRPLLPVPRLNYRCWGPETPGLGAAGRGLLQKHGAPRSQGWNTSQLLLCGAPPSPALGLLPLLLRPPSMRSHNLGVVHI